jgi:hypothetical protein
MRSTAKCLHPTTEAKYAAHHNEQTGLKFAQFAKGLMEGSMKRRTRYGRTIAVAALGAIGLAVGAPEADAGQIQTTLTTQLTVSNNCSLSGPGTIIMTANMTGADANGSTQISYNCPGAGTNPVTATTTITSPNNMHLVSTSPAGSVPYSLCINTASCATGAPGSPDSGQSASLLSPTTSPSPTTILNAATQQVSFSAWVPGASLTTAGVFTDQATITINFSGP